MRGWFTVSLTSVFEALHRRRAECSNLAVVSSHIVLNVRNSRACAVTPSDWAALDAVEEEGSSHVEEDYVHNQDSDSNARKPVGKMSKRKRLRTRQRNRGGLFECTDLHLLVCADR
jgi:hypothetical protein